MYIHTQKSLHTLLHTCIMLMKVHTYTDLEVSLHTLLRMYIHTTHTATYHANEYTYIHRSVTTHTTTYVYICTILHTQKCHCVIGKVTIVVYR